MGAELKFQEHSGLRVQDGRFLWDLTNVGDEPVEANQVSHKLQFARRKTADVYGEHEVDETPWEDWVYVTEKVEPGTAYTGKYELDTSRLQPGAYVVTLWLADDVYWTLDFKIEHGGIHLDYG